LTGGGRLNPPPGIAAEVLPNDRSYADPDLFTSKQRPIEVLIGSDQYYNLVNEKGNFRLSPSLVLLDTIFGWVPAGSFPTSFPLRAHDLSFPRSTLQTLDVPSCSKENEGTLEKLWNLEVLGIQNKEYDPSGTYVIDHFRSTTRREEGRFVACFPWKRDRKTLQTHYRMSLARLRPLVKNYSLEVLRECDNILRDQEMKGIIERAPLGSPYTIHYLPHKPVCHNGKWRIVYDASAKTKTGRSLNDCLYAGPSLTKNSVGLLMNFRMRKQAVEADIEKAFLGVGLDIADRDVVRFIWMADPTKLLEGANLILYRFTRTPFGVNASPFILNMVIQELMSEEPQNWCCRIGRDSFYVDNLVTSLDNTAQVTELYRTLTTKFAEAKFNLRDWVTNDVDALQSIPPHHRGDCFEPIPVLGMSWNVQSDHLSYRFSAEESPAASNLTTALSNLATVYDPLGLAAPCLLDLKLLVQDCHRSKLGWNDPLPSDLETKHRRALSRRNDLKTVTIPRFLWSDGLYGPSYDLHVFTDASEKAFGCTIYLVRTPQERSVGETEASLIYVKSRVSPLQPNRTIPELELMGVLAGKRCLGFVRDQLDVIIQNVTLWTDATTVLHWLHSPKVKGVFVQNRIDELRRTPSLHVRYVPTEDNPADIVSRGSSVQNLQESELWWRGPQWLTSLSAWPETDAVKPYFTSFLTVLPVIEDNILNRQNFGWCKKTNQYRDILLEERWSNWNKYIWLFLFILTPLFRVRKITSVTERQLMAERVLVRLIQRKYFPSDINEIKSKTQLNLFVCDGIIRHRSRLTHPEFAYDEACPALLPRPHFSPSKKNVGSTLVLVLIRHLHLLNCHIGASHLLAKLRQRFWVDKARSLVKSVIHRCTICRRWTGGPFQRPPMDPLPLVRVQPIIPFLNVGIDYFGPLKVTMKLPFELVSEYGQRYRIIDDRGKLVTPTPAHQVNNEFFPRRPLRVVKTVHVCLFTCLVTRAIHLEIAEDLTGDQFLLALDRFCNIFTTPHVIVSDNATNFKYVQPLVGPAVTWQEDKVNTFFRDRQINWHYNPSLSPWYGGVYERLVGVVKRSLEKTLGQSLVDQIVLETALRRVSNIINSRPLTYTSSDEMIQPLTPNHFLKPASVASGDQLEIIRQELPAGRQNMLEGWWHVQGIVENYRNAFHSEYFTALRDVQVRHHRHTRGSLPIRPAVGDVVLVPDVNAPRKKWPLGVIEAVADRTADVKIVEKGYTFHPEPKATINTKRETNTFDKLYPLELSFEPELTPAPTGDHSYI
jgi:hypothetical protein